MCFSIGLSHLRCGHSECERSKEYLEILEPLQNASDQVESEPSDTSSEYRTNATSYRYGQRKKGMLKHGIWLRTTVRIVGRRNLQKVPSRKHGLGWIYVCEFVVDWVGLEHICCRVA
jgi:hypothetical protein